MNWSCLCGTACECTPDFKPLSDITTDVDYILRGLPYLERVQTVEPDWLLLWERLVRTFNSRRLTNVEDRLPALAGLAAAIQRHLQVRYLFGLWSTPGLSNQLLWVGKETHLRGLYRKRTFSPLGCISPDYAPSWSWASCYVETEACSDSLAVDVSAVHEQDRARDEIVLLWSIRDIKINLRTSNPFGPGTGVLQIFSLVVPVDAHWELVTLLSSPSVRFPICSLIYDPVGWDTNDPLVPLRIHLLREEMEIDMEPVPDTWYKDNRANYDHNPRWYKRKRLCFIFSHVRSTKEHAHTFRGLVLERLPGLENGLKKYRRLGYGEGTFSKSLEGEEGLRSAPYRNPPDDFHSTDNFRKGTWEYWQTLGAWETIALV